VYAVLQVLADLAADADGRPRRPVPRLAAQALADQVLVLGHDLAAVAGTEPKLAGHRALVGLRHVL